MSIIPLHKVLTKTDAQKIVRELVKKGAVSWSRHAKQQMEQRDITMQQVLICLEKGRVAENPVLANKRENQGGYDIAVERQTAGDRLRIVVCLRFSQTAFVVTAMKVK